MLTKRLVFLSIIYLFSVCSCVKLKEYSANQPFPRPSGNYAVGIEFLTLSSGPDLSADSISFRYLNLRIWYPLIQARPETYSPYFFQRELIDALKEDQYLDLDEQVIEGWDSLKTYAQIQAFSKIQKSKHPLIIFSHGFGMIKENYSSLSIELASHGYFVVAIDHPGSGLTVLPDGTLQRFTPNPKGPDGKVEEFCQDISFTISELLMNEKFSSVIDDTAIGVIGHSLGGAAALNVGESDDRIKASIDLDAYVFGSAMSEGVRTPFLSILQSPFFENGGIPDSLKMERQLEWQGIVEKSSKSSTVVNITGMMHFDFSDLPFIIPDSLRVKNGGKLPSNRSHEIVSSLSITFFNLTFKKDSSNALNDVISRFSEVNYEVPSK